MKKIFRILPLFLFLFLIDRFMFLPGRMDGIWQYETGTFAGDPIAYDNITIINNFEVQISKSSEFDSFYLLGCYFGRLYLLENTSLEFTKYIEVEESDFID
jgi:hypothetical protein